MTIKDLFVKTPIDLSKVSFGSENYFILFNFDPANHDFRGPTNEFGVARFLALVGDWRYCPLQDFVDFVKNASTGDTSGDTSVENRAESAYKEGLEKIKSIVNILV